MNNFKNKIAFMPSCLHIIINPFYIIRKGIFRELKSIIHNNKINGKLLDFGCGTKPYQSIFNTEDYIGIDIKESGHNHKNSNIDIYYDGNKMPFENDYFDHVFSSEVFEHVPDIDLTLIEINRVLKKNGDLIFSIPFFWSEHEIPYDFRRLTKFGIINILNKHGFEVISLNKTTKNFESIIQIFSAYIVEEFLPANNLKYIIIPLIITPINLFGKIISIFEKKESSIYLNIVCHAKKIK